LAYGEDGCDSKRRSETINAKTKSWKRKELAVITCFTGSVGMVD